jgi:lipoyl(octanoyl) transferase
MLDLKRRGTDVRRFVAGLEEWMIRTLARFNIKGERRVGRVGIWIDEGQGRESKIAAIGVRVRQWVTYHGVSLNVDPDLAHYRGIVACGVRGHGLTSLAAQGIAVGMAEVDAALKATFDRAFATDRGPGRAA